MIDIGQAEKALGYTFKDKGLLQRALTVASASEDNNQLLEFFGDAILEFIVSERIFSEGGSEGELTERRKTLVSDVALTPVSEKLGLDKLLIFGKNDSNNKKAIPSAYEAACAAIYLDGGMDAVKNFVLSTLDFSAVTTVVNYKGKLQELLQGAGKPIPEYNHTDIGNAHKHIFEVKISLFDKTFIGEADSVKQAEQLAAKNALEYIEEKGLR
ncbi:MAG: hypothetical protein K2N23_00660 [Clostridia bacterium]|nr:hypothetical protein [Clostridia bacterium]